MEALGLTCEDALYIVPPLLAFGLGAAVAKTSRWGDTRTWLPEPLHAPLRNPIINGLAFALVTLLVIWLAQQSGVGKRTYAYTDSYDSLLPPELYGSGGLMPATGSAATGGLTDVGFDNTYPP